MQIILLFNSILLKISLNVKIEQTVAVITDILRFGKCDCNTNVNMFKEVLEKNRNIFLIFDEVRTVRKLE
jgi:hypothetical protein